MSNIEHLEICNVYYNTSKLNNFTLSQYYNHMSDNCNDDNQIEKNISAIVIPFSCKVSITSHIKTFNIYQAKWLSGRRVNFWPLLL